MIFYSYNKPVEFFTFTCYVCGHSFKCEDAKVGSIRVKTQKGHCKPCHNNITKRSKRYLLLRLNSKIRKASKIDIVESL